MHSPTELAVPGTKDFLSSYFVRDPLLQSLRDQPEFQALMNQALHRHDQFKAAFF
jgi:hypothetical protein